MKIRCPWCQASNNRLEVLLGALGRLSHYRCRYCGGDVCREGR
jgi:transposase-like protein